MIAAATKQDMREAFPTHQDTSDLMDDAAFAAEFEAKASNRPLKRAPQNVIGRIAPASEESQAAFEIAREIEDSHERACCGV